MPYLLKEGDLIQCFEEALEVFWVAATTLSLEHSARMKFYPRPDLSPGHNAWVYVNLSSCVCLVSLFYSTLSPGWCPVTRHESGSK